MFQIPDVETLEKKYGRYIKKVFYNLSKNVENTKDYYQTFLMDWHEKKYAFHTTHYTFKTEKQFLSFLSYCIKNAYKIFVKGSTVRPGLALPGNNRNELSLEELLGGTPNNTYDKLEIADLRNNEENIQFQVMFAELLHFVEMKSKKNPGLKDIFLLLLQEYNLADIAEVTSGGLKKNNTPLKNPRASSLVAHKVNELRRLARAYFSS